MYSANQYLIASSVQEAVQELQKSPSNRILAGGTWLRMCSLRIGTLIDMSRLGLDQIEERDGEVRIGAFTPLRDVETNSLLQSLACGILPAAVKDIVGVQFRNCATIGAGIYSVFGFSDPLCALLALDAEVELAVAGRMKLAEFINIRKNRKNRDILLYLYLKNDGCKGAFQSFRQTATDYSVLNLCAVQSPDGLIRIAVGARPGKACRCTEAEELLQAGNAKEALRAVSGLPFGTNLRGSSQYRQALAGVLLEDALKQLEVIKQ